MVGIALVMHDAKLEEDLCFNGIIGAGGIRVRSSDPVLPDTDIVLSLAAREEILLSGSVLWAITAGQSSTEFEMGIEAEALIFKEQEAIGHADREALVEEILSRIRRDPL